MWRPLPCARQRSILVPAKENVRHWPKRLPLKLPHNQVFIRTPSKVSNKNSIKALSMYQTRFFGIQVEGEG